MSFKLHSKDDYFINMPIPKYDQMEIIFGKNHLKNPIKVETLQLALINLMDNEAERIIYRVMTPKRKK